MHFYGLTREQVLNLPIKTFWFMNKAVDRISAEQAVRQLQVGVASQSSEGATQLSTHLQQQIGRVYEGNLERPVFEREKLKRLVSRLANAK